MKAIIYNIQPSEKEIIVKANAKKHDLTLIANDLNLSTVAYSSGKEAVIISNHDKLDQPLLIAIQQLGISQIITRSRETGHIDLETASNLGLKVANAPATDDSLENIATQTIRNLSLWEKGKCVGNACCCQKNCEKIIP